MCLGTMANHWGNTTDSYSFRFFSPEQVDQILCDGAKRGREGSHAAIERILKLELGLERAELWQRIRRLKNLSRQPRYRRSVWSVEDEETLREGYANGHSGKQQAVRELLRRHPEWRPHIVWRRAAKLDLTKSKAKHNSLIRRRPWSEDDDRILLNLAGYKSAKAIGKKLHRTERAVLGRLSVLGKSCRVHKEGYARRALAEELHLGTRTIQRLILEGRLEVHDPRITKRSLDDLLKSLQGSEPPPQIPDTESTTSIQGEAPHNPVSIEASANGTSASSTRASRSKRFWAEAAATLGVSIEAVEQYIAKGVLELCDSRITEKSLRSFCRRYGSMINHDFLNQETRAWLKDSLDLVPGAGESAARALEPYRRHARVVRKCKRCGHTFRGNVYFRHIKRCRGVAAGGREMELMSGESTPS